MLAGICYCPLLHFRVRKLLCADVICTCHIRSSTHAFGSGKGAEIVLDYGRGFWDGRVHATTAKTKGLPKGGPWAGVFFTHLVHDEVSSFIPAAACLYYYLVGSKNLQLSARIITMLGRCDQASRQLPKCNAVGYMVR